MEERVYLGLIVPGRMGVYDHYGQKHGSRQVILAVEKTETHIPIHNQKAERTVYRGQQEAFEDLSPPTVSHLSSSNRDTLSNPSQIVTSWSQRCMGEHLIQTSTMSLATCNVLCMTK